MSGAEQHQWAVAQTLGFAQEAAARGDFEDALQWLRVVEVVDGVLPVEWQRTRAVWGRGLLLARVRRRLSVPRSPLPGRRLARER